MKMTRWWLAAGAAAATVLLLLAVMAGFGSANAREGVFIHISHGQNDPHRVLMALQMANIMAEDHDVLVYFDIKGVDVVLRDADDVTYGHFTPAQEQFSTLLSKGVTIMACPGCLKAAGKNADDLAEGIKVAEKENFFSFTKGRILTLDY